MLTSTSNQDHSESQTADVLIPLIRAAATIGFAIAPCSLGFVIIAVSERMIRSIMVGDDPEMLVSDLQNQFPNDAFEVADKDEGLMAQVMDLIDCPEQAAELPLDTRHCVDHLSMQWIHLTDQHGATWHTKVVEPHGGGSE